MTNDKNDETSQQDRKRKPLNWTTEGTRLAILAGVAVLIAISAMNLYETRRQRIELNDRMTQLATAINARPAANPAPARPTGPDPEKVYTVKTEGAPFQGPRSAPITIVEISDFQ